MHVSSLNHSAPSYPVPTTSGTGTPISSAYEKGGDYWSSDAFVEVTGPATSGDPIPFAFDTKEQAIAAATSLSHGAQPALAVLFDSSSGSTASKPWIVQAVQMANPTEDGFFDRAGKFNQTGWKVHTHLIDLETGGNSSAYRKLLQHAPFVSSVAAIVDGSVLITPATTV